MSAGRRWVELGIGEHEPHEREQQHRRRPVRVGSGPLALTRTVDGERDGVERVEQPVQVAARGGDHLKAQQKITMTATGAMLAPGSLVPSAAATMIPANRARPTAPAADQHGGRDRARLPQGWLLGSGIATRKTVKASTTPKPTL